MGQRGRVHHDIATRTATLALSLGGKPSRILDVGCGTGLLLRFLAERLPDAKELVGIDAAPGMIVVAKSASSDPRVRFSTGVAESLSFPDALFDLVVSTTSFDHWEDQGVGLAECARVLDRPGHFVLVDLFSPWLVPTLFVGDRGYARTRHRANRLLAAAGFRAVEWHRLYALIIGAAVASK
jgi:ubiquinone/menaquinone biosynthesis C-methylase UbiE